LIQAADVVEHPELIADRIITFAQVISQEKVITGTDYGLGAPRPSASPGPSCATARRWRARSYGVEFQSAVRDERNKRKKFEVKFLQ
jgi:hypothetical protein